MRSGETRSWPAKQCRPYPVVQSPSDSRPARVTRLVAILALKLAAIIDRSDALSIFLKSVKEKPPMFSRNSRNTSTELNTLECDIDSDNSKLKGTFVLKGISFDPRRRATFFCVLGLSHKGRKRGHRDRIGRFLCFDIGLHPIQHQRTVIKRCTLAGQSPSPQTLRLGVIAVRLQHTAIRVAFHGTRRD